jgi:signal transduction histidine kinase
MQKSIRKQLLLWYIGSIAVIAFFFWFGVHVYMIEYGEEIFLGLLILLSIIGFLVIHSITNSLSTFSKKIKTISSTNLQERIHTKYKEKEIAELAQSFNELLERIENSFKRERQFIGDVAHELKTPLATMRSNIEVGLTKKRKEEEYQTMLSESLIDIDRMSSTIQDVLDLAWTDAHVNQPFTKKVNLTDLLTELVEIIESLASSKDIQIKSSIKDNVIVYGESEKLGRAFLNVLTNAVKYTNNKGMISVLLAKEKNKAIITVSDTGIGINKKDIKHVFNRFYRADNARKQDGTGLGLSIAKSIIQIHRGTMSIKSTKGKGTKVIISLPQIHE